MIATTAITAELAFAECPQPEQPALSQGLTQLISSGRSVSALDCIRKIASDAESSGAKLSDEVAYQLASQGSNAIETLGGAGNVKLKYHELAAGLWKRYLEGAQEPLDLLRQSFGAKKLDQHARLLDYPIFAPTIVASSQRSKEKLGIDVVAQVFTTLNRCPHWNKLQKHHPLQNNFAKIACTEECRTFFVTLAGSFVSEPSSAASRSQIEWQRNATIFKERLKC